MFFLKFYFIGLILCPCHLFVLAPSQISSTGIDFGIVGQCCPLLEKLTVSKEPSRTVTLTNTEAPIYTELQELKVGIFLYFTETTFLLHILACAESNLFSFQMTCTISLECGSMFFTNATKLRRVEIIRIQGLSDDILASWLKRNPLQLLEVVIQAILKSLMHLNSLQSLQMLMSVLCFVICFPKCIQKCLVLQGCGAPLFLLH